MDQIKIGKFKQKNKKEVVLDNNKNKVENLINKGINIKMGKWNMHARCKYNRRTM